MCRSTSDVSEERYQQHPRRGQLLSCPLPSACLNLSLLQEVNHQLATIDELSAKQLGDALTAYGVKAPDTKNDISAPFPFNLMFKTSIGPRGDQVGYLRPETAQGLFVNFRSDIPAKL